MAMESHYFIFRNRIDKYLFVTPSKIVILKEASLDKVIAESQLDFCQISFLHLFRWLYIFLFGVINMMRSTDFSNVKPNLHF